MNLKVNNAHVVLRQVRKGRHCTLYAMGDNQTCALKDFFTEARQDHRKEFDKLVALIDYVADNGPPRNEQKCRCFAGEKLFELKTPGGLRVMAFWDENQVIIGTHGFLKKKQKTPLGQLARAIDARKLYFQAKQLQAIRIEDAPQ